MSESTAIVILVEYTIIVLALLISTCLMIRAQLMQNRVWKMMLKDLTCRNNVLTAQRDREREVGQIFAKVLFDLAYSTNVESIQWKLQSIRLIGDELTHHPDIVYYYDNNYHNWMMNILTKAAPQHKNDVMRIINRWTKNYYVMDPQNGENIVKIIDELMEVEAARKESKQAWLQQLEAFAKCVKDSGFHFPILDTFPEEKKEPVKSVTFEEILAEIESDPILWGGPNIEEVKINEEPQSNSRTEKFDEGHEDIPEQELQGEETEPVCSEDATESNPISETPEVIIMSGTKAC